MRIPNEFFDGAATNLLVEIAVLRKKGDKSWMESRYLPTSKVNEALDSMEPGDVYFGPALRSKPSSQKEAIAGGRVAWVDYDGPSPVPLVPPSFIVRTPHRPGYHLYWLLDEALPGEKLEELNQALVSHLGSAADHCWNMNRVMRVPGSIDTRVNEEVVLLLQQPGRVYSVDYLLRHSKVDRKTTHKVRTGDSRGYQSRSERDFNVMASLLLAGLDEGAIRDLFFSSANKISEKTLTHDKPEYYFDRTLGNAKKFVAKRNLSSRKAQAPKREPEIIEKPEGYFFVGGQGEERQLSTFTFKPSLLLEGGEGKEDVFIGTMITERGTVPNVQLPQSAFNSSRNLMDKLPSADWQWLGSDTNAKYLLPYLVKQCPRRARGVTQVGLTQVDGNWYLVLPDGTYSQDQFWPYPEGPVVHVRGHITPPTPAVSPGAVPSEPGVAEILRTVLQINTPEAIYPIVGWWLAAPFKPVLAEHGLRFPVLNVTGTQGSGKTSTVLQLMRLYAYNAESRNTYDSNTTRFVMLSLLGCSVSFPIVLAEFRASRAADYLLRYVRLAYDLGHDPRGRPNQTVEDYELSSPFVVDGEDALSEPAARERTICVRLHRKHIAPHSPAADAFNMIASMPLGIFADHYLPWVTEHTDLVMGWWERARRLMGRAFPEHLPHRVRHNYTVVTMGLLIAEEFTGVPMPKGEDLRLVLMKPITFVHDPLTGRGQAHIDEMIEGICNELQAKQTLPFPYHYSTEENVLYFAMTAALHWWRKEARRAGQETLELPSLQAQLTEAPYTKNGASIEGQWMVAIRMEVAAQSLDVPAHFTHVWGTVEVT